MKIMGLDNWIHWTAWFLKNFIMLAVSAILITIIMKVITEELSLLLPLTQYETIKKILQLKLGI